jgi:WD40 repeat protein
MVIRLWTLADHSCRILEGHTRHVLSVAFAPDGLSLASGSEDQSIRISDVIDGSCTKVLRIDVVWSVAFSPDGATLASGGVLIIEDDEDKVLECGVIVLWDLLHAVHFCFSRKRAENRLFGPLRIPQMVNILQQGVTI